MGINLKDIKNLTLEEIQNLIDTHKLSGEVVTFTLPLDTAFNNFPVSLAGNFIGCISATDGNVSATLEFSSIGTGQITFTQGLYMGRPFTRFFVTSSAQSGKTITFIVSTISTNEFFIQDNRSQGLTASLLTSILGEIQGDTTPENWGTEKTVGTSAVAVIASNTSRHGATIQSKFSNTGIIYVGFDSTVTSSKWVWQLQAGEQIPIDDYRGDLYAISDTAGQLVGWGEW